MSKKTTRVSALYLRLAALFSSTDETHLHVVRVEPHPDGGVICVGASNQSIGIFYDSDGFIPRPMNLSVRHALGEMLTAENGDHVTIDDENIILKDYFGQEIYIQTLGCESDEPFCDWRKISLQYARSLSCQFTIPGALAPQFITVAKYLRERAISFYPSDTSWPLLIRIGPDFFGVMMPDDGRGSKETADPFPAWLDKQLQTDGENHDT